MSQFVDRAPLTVKSGNGGNGCVSFHREKFIQNGGPDGGDGGPNRKNGKRGADLVIKVPVGTVVHDKMTGALVADMYEAGRRKVILSGGRGGWGNARFATPTRQAPNFAKPGLKTEIRELYLELKSIADVGLVGYPNVGKSTILSVVTAAKPKIANYHFTTLTPNLGLVRHAGTDFVMADIPGIIEGASEGAGLGLDFLRHIERTRLLLHVIDMSGLEGRDPLEDYERINQELASYGDLKERPQLIVANKMDLPEAQENLQRFKQKVQEPVYEVSAATRQGFDELMNAVVSTLSQLPKAEPFAEETWDPMPMQELSQFTVVRADGVFEVQGPAVTHLVDSVNFEDEESLNWFHHTLRAAGMIDALRKAGAQEGSTVRMGDMEFDFID